MSEEADEKMTENHVEGKRCKTVSKKGYAPVTETTNSMKKHPEEKHAAQSQKLIFHK